MESVSSIPTILGIETSCDETAAAVVSRSPDGSARIHSNIVLSQIHEHSPYGGVVPEIAARTHVEHLDRVIARALDEAGTPLDRIDAIAVTTGPGLIGGLIVGMMTAKAIAAAADKRLYCINHLEGHALTARLTHGLDFPYLLLLVSGGHTQVITVESVGRYRRYATTIDDALGEAFDKTAKLLGLPHPGGPAVEAAAERGNATAIALPRPMKGETRADFSFSGLKTAVRHAAVERAPLSASDIADICASFQLAVADSLADRVALGLARFEREHAGIARPTLVAAGGVAANRMLRSRLESLCTAHGFRFLAPPTELCTDNAAMIAWAGLERMRIGDDTGCSMSAAPRSRWPLDELSTPVLGSGKRGAKA